MENKPDDSNVDDATIVVSRTAETIDEATIVTSNPVVLDEATIVTSTKDLIEEATVTGDHEQTFYTEVPVSTSSGEPYLAPAEEKFVPLAEPSINGWGETIIGQVPEIIVETPVAEGPVVVQESQKVFDTPMKNVDDELVEYVEEIEPNPVDLGNASELYEKAMKRRRMNSRGVLIAVVVCFALIGGTIAVLWSQLS